MLSLPRNLSNLVSVLAVSTRNQAPVNKKGCSGIFSRPRSVMEATYLPEIMRNHDLRRAVSEATGRKETDLMDDAARRAGLGGATFNRLADKFGSNNAIEMLNMKARVPTLVKVWLSNGRTSVARKMATFAIQKWIVNANEAMNIKDMTRAGEICVLIVGAFSLYSRDATFVASQIG